MADEKKLLERIIPGMNRVARFTEAENAENVGGTFRRIVTYFAREKAMVLFMLLVVVFGTLCGVYAPSLQSNAIDMIAGSKSGNLPACLGLMLGVYLVYSGCQLLQGLLSTRISQRLVKRMREELFGKLVDVPVRYLDTHAHGDVMSRMTNDIENISTTVSQSLPSLFSGVLNCIGNIGFVIIAAFGGYFSVNGLISVGDGLISVGVISAFVVYAKQFSRPINEIAQIYGQLQTAIVGAERVFAVLDEDGEDMAGETLAEEDTSVYFENVNFAYEPGHPVIRDFTLTVPSGKKVALVGSTGSSWQLPGPLWPIPGS